MSLSMFLARLAGARADVLKSLPGAIPKQAAMGAVILTTAGFAATSAAYALYIIGVASGLTAILIGLVWGFAILNIDRLLVIGLSNETRVRRNLMLAAPRVALALVIGIVISTPLMLKVFEPEVTAQMTTNNIEALNAGTSVLQNGDLKKQLEEREAEMDRLRSLINAGATADPSVLPEVKDIQNQIREKQTIADRQHQEFVAAEQAYIAESDGSGGTGVRGCALECVIKRDAKDEKKARWEATLGEIKALEAKSDGVVNQQEGSLLEASQRRIEDAKKELPKVEQNVGVLRKAVESAESGTIDGINKNTGIIARLKALDDVTDGNSLANAARWAVALLFICIELLPVIFKVVSNLGRRTKYDEVVDAFEGNEAAEATRDSDTQKQKGDMRRNADIAAEKQRVEEQHKVILKMNSTVVKHQADVVEDALQIWSSHAKSLSAQHLSKWGATLHSGVTKAAAPTPRSPQSSHPPHANPARNGTAHPKTGTAGPFAGNVGLPNPADPNHP